MDGRESMFDTSCFGLCKSCFVSWLYIALAHPYVVTFRTGFTSLAMCLQARLFDNNFTSLDNIHLFQVLLYIRAALRDPMVEIKGIITFLVRLVYFDHSLIFISYPIYS